jgi:hypothetical protein
MIVRERELELFKEDIMAQINKPNLYELKNVDPTAKDTRITYSTSSISGEPIFDYKDTQHEKHFTGNEIHTQNTEVGILVTVVLEAIPDLKTLTATLLIPGINLEDSASPFKTVLLLTTNRTSIAGPAIVKGPLQTYEIVALEAQPRV